MKNILKFYFYFRSWKN